ncbi:MAG: nuclear transport factor 2 family protein [Candidatus Freyarchaeum deiterrae]
MKSEKKETKEFSEALAEKKVISRSAVKKKEPESHNTDLKLVEKSKLEELEARIKVLEDIEAIKRLRAKYWRCCDRKLWNELEECFTENVVADYFPNLHFDGRKALMDFLKGSLSPDIMITSHGGHSPEIEIISDTEARGIWVLNDLVILQPGMRMRGYGHYEDEYVKENGQWKINRSKQTRIIEEWQMDKR